MKKNLHLLLFLFVLLFSVSQLKGQTDRVNLDISHQKIEVIPANEINSTDNIPEMKSTIKLQQNNLKGDSLLSKQMPVSNTFLSKESTKSVNIQKRSQRTDVTDDDNGSIRKKMEAPLFPDFKVEAIQETASESDFSSKEKSSQQLTRLERVPSDDIQVTGVTSDGQSSSTISPAKRKYLEGLVIELEKEIDLNKNNTSIEIQAKRKELEELKKLLIQ